MTTYSIYEAADKLGISVSVLRREIYKKKLTGRKFGGRVRASSNQPFVVRRNQPHPVKPFQPLGCK